MVCFSISLSMDFPSEIFRAHLLSMESPAYN